MKHVSILLPHFVNLAGFENARQGLHETNEFLKTQGKSPVFNIEIVSIVPEIQVNNGQYTIKADKLLHEINTTDIIIIPPIQNNIAEALQLNHEFYPWINAQHQAGAQIVSLCLGAFLLASTGLLNDRDCVTHWRASEPFKQLFPKVNLLSDKIMTDEDGIYTGGGAFSSANLILYVIEKMVDRETAIYCSKIFQIDAGRTSQSPFIIFKAQKNHADVDVKIAQTFIEKNYMDKIIIDDLCNLIGIGRRTFERRFKKATANTIIEYLQRIRVEAAKKQLELGIKTVNEIMFDVGYSDTKAFRATFKKITGLSPIEYKNKYNKVLVN